MHHHLNIQSQMQRPLDCIIDLGVMVFLVISSFTFQVYYHESFNKGAPCIQWQLLLIATYAASKASCDVRIV